ncbi:MAG: hypothetical protein R3228_14065 [Halioglobus sp.]|nr:hypothetical protein [Halioglobus sp.]
MTDTVRVNGFLQEGAQPDRLVREIESSIQSTYRRFFGKHWRLRYTWFSLPPGQSFVAGEPSRTSTVQVAVPDGTDDEVRHAFMREVCDIWMARTGCSENEIVLSVPDSSYAKRFMASNIDRIDPRRRAVTALRMARHLLWSRLRRGIAVMSINLSRAG